MAQHRKSKSFEELAQPASHTPGRRPRAGLLFQWAVTVIGSVGLALGPGSELAAAPTAETTISQAASGTNPAASPAAAPRVQPAVSPTNALPVLEINRAIMVTVELDFGPKVPSIAEGLREVERRSQPDDGQGRTFAILDAYGEPTPQGKLHMSMHVSTEKPGVGALVFRRTGQVLWQSRIVAGTNATPFSGKNLMIYLDDGAGKSVTVDGSKNPASILEATVKEAAVAVSLFWPDGAEREVTFVYSACGCPVKAMVRRVGDRTVRTKELPVLFPDDPAALAVITRLMGW